MKKMSVRILTAALIICSVICANVFTPFTKVNAGGASDEFELHVIECKEGGLATLIDVNNKYVLVDGGEDENTVANYLKQNCVKRNGKVVLESIILTHNHNDHINGILTILNDTNNFKVQQIFMEDIYKPGSKYEGEMNAAIQKQRKANNEANVPNAIHMVKKAGNGKYKPANGFRSADVDNVSINVYPPVKDFVNIDTGHQIGYYMNESSLVVKVTGKSGSALIMGDAYDRGFAGLVKEYADNEFKSDFCILAHHGLRSDRSKTVEDIKLYNKYILARTYIFAASEGQLHAEKVEAAKRKERKENYKANYELFRDKLVYKKSNKKKNSTKYATWAKGTIQYNSANGNVDTERGK